MDPDPLQKWAQYAAQQAVLHAQASSGFRKRDIAVAVVAVVLAVISGSGNLTSVEGTGNLVFGSLGVLSGGLMALHRYLALPEQRERHATAATDFEKLGLDIRADLTGPTLARDIDQSGGRVAIYKSRLHSLMDRAPSVVARIDVPQPITVQILP